MSNEVIKGWDGSNKQPISTDSQGRPLTQQETSNVSAGNSSLTIKAAHIDVASSGENTIVSAVTGSKIRVLSILVSSDSQENVEILDGTGGSVLQKFYLAANGTVTESAAQGWLIETSAGNALIANLSGANNTSVRVTYIEV